MAFQRHVWSAFDFSEIGPELTYNDLGIVWLKMQSVPFKANYSMDYAQGVPDRQNRISGAKPNTKWLSRAMVGASSTSQKTDRN